MNGTKRLTLKRGKNSYLSFLFLSTSIRKGVKASLQRRIRYRACACLRNALKGPFGDAKLERVRDTIESFQCDRIASIAIDSVLLLRQYRGDFIPEHRYILLYLCYDTEPTPESHGNVSDTMKSGNYILRVLDLDYC